MVGIELVVLTELKQIQGFSAELRNTDSISHKKENTIFYVHARGLIVQYTIVRNIIYSRCLLCHSSSPELHIRQIYSQSTQIPTNSFRSKEKYDFLCFTNLIIF